MFKVRQVIWFRGKEYVLIKIRNITRGRMKGKKEFTLAPIKPQKFYSMWVKGDGKNFELSKCKHSTEEIEKVIARERNLREEAEFNKLLREEARQKKVEMLGIEVGDEILVRYSDGSKVWKTVVKKNTKTGKLAITKYYIADVEGMIRDLENGVYDGQKRKPYRWLCPACIADSRKKK